MLKSFKYRLYPTNEQSILLNKHIGASRFVYNLALECKQMAWIGNRINLSCFQLHSQLKGLKLECQWLKEINSQSLQQSITNLDKAYSSFFKGQNKYPKFKKKSKSGSFNIPQNVILKGDKLIIPKFKKGINVKIHKQVFGEIRHATISKSPSGKYFVSVLFETGVSFPEKKTVSEKSTIGIDLGIKTFIVCSDGIEYENPKFLKKSQKKLSFYQKKYSKNKGKKTMQKLVILHEKVSNKRKDFLQKVSTDIIKNHDSIAIETLKVSNMLKNHKLANSISDASWYTFVSMLEYKAQWYGKNILKIGTFEPSSKMCSNCGVINRNLKLKDREWNCSGCGEKVFRDVNAAINIKSFALKNILSGADRKNHDELPTLVGVMTHEAR